MFYRILCSVFGLLAGLSFSPPNAGAIVIWAENRVYTCRISGDSVDFGTIADTDLYSKTVGAKIKADCERPFLTGITLIPLPYGAYCVAISGNTAGGGAAGTRYLANENNADNKIYFNFYDAKNPSLPIGENFTDGSGFLSGFPNIGLSANFFGSFSMDFPVDVRLFNRGTDGSIASGAYSGQFQAQMYYGATIPVLFPSWSARSASDCRSLPKGPVFGAITVKANVKSSCSIDSVSNIDFGKVPVFRLAEGISETGAVSAHCSKGDSYQIGLSSGLHKDKALAGYRAMQLQGGNDFIAYDLYQDSGHSVKWTDAWGTGDTIKVENGSGGSLAHPVYAYIPKQSDYKTTGVYRDTVVVEIRLNAR